MVRGAEDSVYKRLHTQYDALLGEEESKTNSYGITYHKTFPLPDFEKMINGEVLIKQLPNGYMWAQFEANGKKQVAQVHKTIRKQKDTPKQSMAVSLCKDANGQVFWLLHHKNKPTRFEKPTVDIDRLTEDLDSLLIS